MSGGIEGVEEDENRMLQRAKIDGVSRRVRDNMRSMYSAVEKGERLVPIGRKERERERHRPGVTRDDLIGNAKDVIESLCVPVGNT